MIEIIVIAKIEAKGKFKKIGTIRAIKKHLNISYTT